MPKKMVTKILGVLAVGTMLTAAPVWGKGPKQGQGNVVVQETTIIHPGPASGGTPYGWSQGKKTGWHKKGTVMPPGQQKNLLEKGKVPKHLQ
uniref:Uncharacterized protein n=1 Tax=Desulfobacca acetoxidans TaxID=60893 RepID=A0A7V4LDA1_9BACT